MSEPSPLPGKWIPMAFLQGADLGLPLRVPEDAWIRLIHHDERGAPYLMYVLFWITPGLLHLARCEGWVEDDSDLIDDVDDRRVLTHERISFERIEEYNLDLATGQGFLKVTGQPRREDLPMIPIVSYLNEGPGGMQITKH
ncbi:hypothetical protein ACUN7V_15500 [Quadrisphaera oryzae]|uniref:hypothetical protein n=1 Tax=Quadrisphaera TaxID=317661 RepID=UPI001644235D|nr:hypothetical protein [Quadrisphaera sp. RL12-1S]MBC3760616.1 hypothetical protein [Quadrisphaera sp. RL12-1S]